jgi:hypothetical protein
MVGELTLPNRISVFPATFHSIKCSTFITADVLDLVTNSVIK